jgi:hypothetical protein
LEIEQETTKGHSRYLAMCGETYKLKKSIVSLIASYDFCDN